MSHGVWRNWGRTASSTPVSVKFPSSEEEISLAVTDAYDADLRVKVVGSGHSFTDIAATDGVMLSLRNYDRILELDSSRSRVTVEAGISLESLSEQLAANGLALENMGDIGYQSVAGAISTSTHGTGAKLGGLANQIVGLSLVLADGSTRYLSLEDDPELFRGAQVSLGALGVISTVTIQCVPAFNLHALERPMRLDAVLEELDELVDQNEHFEFWWFPHTETAYIKANNRTDESRTPKGAWRSWYEDIFLSNHVFGFLCRIGRAWPNMIPRLNGFEAGMLGKLELVERSDRVFTSPRLVRFAEMEYAIPRGAVKEAVRAVKHLIESREFKVSFIVEVRFVASDEIPMSTSYGRETSYIAVHMFEGTPYDEYFRGVETVMNEHEGRPHWGKLHTQDAGSLSKRYTLWDQFISSRRKLDPEGRFSNAYLDRILGPL